jgi:hypothetical protein
MPGLRHLSLYDVVWEWAYKTMIFFKLVFSQGLDAHEAEVIQVLEVLTAHSPNVSASIVSYSTKQDRTSRKGVICLQLFISGLRAAQFDFVILGARFGYYY